MKIYDSYSNELKEFEPIDKDRVTMYVCGPTVYDLPHLGHARCYITWDMVYRYLKYRGYNVIYARNITDVDDKIINKAKAENTTPAEIADKFSKEFHKSMKALNILTPDIEPKATENIDAMINIINKLIKNDYAYESNGDVYFRVNKFEKYGMLSNQSIKDLEAGARVEISEIKENNLDFALWKATKDPDEISWDSPWGKGRPGWHIECSAMSKRFLAETIDIHAGGSDLLFPHHENEIAQSECSSGKPFVKYWLHNGFVTINNEKMSKSLGNFTTISSLLETYDSNTIRFFILTNHYRQPVEFSDVALESAKAGVERLKHTVNDVLAATGELSDDVNVINEYNEQFINAMDNDFNTSQALSILFELANLAQKTKDEDKTKAQEYLQTLLTLSTVLGFDLKGKQSIDCKLTSDLMEIIIDIRKQARLDKNWVLSDKIRDDLQSIGITLKDDKDGTCRWIIQ